MVLTHDTNPQTRGYIPPGVGIINDDPKAYKMLTYTEQILNQSDGVSRPIILQSLEYLLGIVFNLIEEDEHQTIVDIMAELTGKVLELTNRSEVLHEDHLRDYYKYNPLVARQLIVEQQKQSDQQH
ncbi:hypothetical protein OXYTRIMIC_181 [Oxytricha trifallax]|uniref:Uncharacterized protein n=1 Tax=Oxytricha trifallax TaxID=1172189 RepID=A0A073HYS8_9SPIT|nr:hypothetical protein OXYTRIMIC_181 [Oxytricha trifallax]